MRIAFSIFSCWRRRSTRSNMNWRIGPIGCGYRWPVLGAYYRVRSAQQNELPQGGHCARFEGGWTKAMPRGAIQFDQTGLNTLSVPIMVQWRNKELVTVWPKDVLSCDLRI
jgi:hypothetical protein